MKTICTILFCLAASIVVGQDTIYTYQGKIITDNNRVLKKDYITAKVSAYLTVPDTTVCTTAGKTYFLQGVFNNDIVESFTFEGDTLVYDNGNNKPLFISYHLSLASDKSNATIETAIEVGGVLIPGGECPAQAKTAGDEYSFGSSFIVNVNHGDKIKILVKTDKANSTITTAHCSAAAFEIR